MNVMRGLRQKNYLNLSTTKESIIFNRTSEQK